MIINFLASLNWTAIIITIAICLTIPRLFNLTLQMSKVLRDIARICVQMEELRQREKAEVMKYRCVK